jgi:hypothetical protein
LMARLREAGLQPSRCSAPVLIESELKADSDVRRVSSREPVSTSLERALSVITATVIAEVAIIGEIVGADIRVVAVVIIR